MISLVRLGLDIFDLNITPGRDYACRQTDEWDEEKEYDQVEGDD